MTNYIQTCTAVGNGTMFCGGDPAFTKWDRFELLCNLLYQYYWPTLVFITIITIAFLIHRYYMAQLKVDQYKAKTDRLDVE